MKTTDKNTAIVTDKPKHAGGRPTKYTPELLAKAHEYVDGAWRDEDAVPMIVGLAIHCGIHKSMVYEWMKDPEKQEFSDIALRVEQMQERYLAKGGLTNDMNPNITKLLLSKHGYSDKQEIDHTTKGEKIGTVATPEQLENAKSDILARLKARD